METWLTRYEWCTRQSWRSPTGMSFWPSGQMIEPARVLVNHSTETVGFPGYNNGAAAPHFTTDLVSGLARQHIPLEWGSRCLAVSTGGVTDRTVNITGTIQIEVIGAVTPGYPRTFGHYDLPNRFPSDRRAQEHLARLWRAIWEATGRRIPLQLAANLWVPHPQSYGVHARQRMNSATFRRARGVLGHQHAVANSHGDGVYGRVVNGGVPDIEQVLVIARGGSGGVPGNVKAPAGSRWEVDTTELNCRSGPGTQFDVIGSAKRGLTITATGRTSGPWLEGQTPWQKDHGHLGWWHSQFLRKLENTPAPPKPDETTRQVQAMAIRFGIDVGESGADGFYGPDTRVAVAEYTASYGYTGDPMNVRALLTHMEATMATVLEELRALRAELAKKPNRDEIGGLVWGHPIYGFSAHWHLRMGLITNPSHPNFPADPDSPMFYMLREWANSNDGRVAIYTPEGVVQMALNPDTDIFEIVEDEEES